MLDSSPQSLRKPSIFVKANGEIMTKLMTIRQKPTVSVLRTPRRKSNLRFAMLQAIGTSPLLTIRPVRSRSNWEEKFRGIAAVKPEPCW
jgi:hypothetical protein